MRNKSQAAKSGENAELSTEATHESTMTPSEKSEGGTNPSLKKVKSPSTSRSSSKKKVNTVSIRRSERIQNSTPLNFKIQNVVEEITLSESDKEDELPTDHEKSSPSPSKQNGWPELMMGTRSFEAKIDDILKLFETHGHTLDSIKTEVIKRSFLVETVPTPDMNYKSMYIASQKKIEELAEENRVLTKKLENAHERFEAYKNGNRDAFVMLEKLKDVVLILNGLRASESTQATSQVELDKVTVLNAGNVPPSSKRKKLTKQK
ncbi:uncharacterized protein LOC111488838 isoform X2 [Cucurbita maxima]|uniref:Uncharacterized protein LOC111488838 isoform X2 n=1 Tax=Cucurbita maxima TaxID=3661 RepID=A0A6J1JW00_CUCMA|nr:uncharacterized protein LOC111488838 isoform X2 [Cucurbita maxima]